ncbi:MAG: CDP-diacylglycerol O-phosphatidyltransferase [Armatimonadetes bacterium]|nr:CDP-diacylglycerol O-phosphatidyltransferase [Armatimonadota bacterium]
MTQSTYPRALGWAVHFYTACGAVFGLLALQAVWGGRISQAFFWMAITIVIDSTDGFLARKVQVRRLVPHIDGRTLDDIVDYFTYVVVPVFFMVGTGLLPNMILVASFPLIASGFGFANRQAKTEDDFFLGFPSYWNVVAFYLWLFGLPPQVNAAVIVLLSVLVMIPVRYIYPSKTRQYRGTTLVLAIAWGLQLLIAFVWPEGIPGWWLWSTLYFPVYYLAASLHLHRSLPPSSVPSD